MAENDDPVEHRKSKRSEEVKDSQQQRELKSISPIEPLPQNGTRVNPFLALPIKKTETVQDTMDYFVTICKGLTSRSMPGQVNPHLSLLLPYALKHAVLFEAIISVCRASILLSLGRPIWEDCAFVQHRGSAIAKLNDKLQSKEATDNAALLTVTMLMTLDYLCGDQKGVLMHCRGLERMLELRGTIQDEDDPDNDTEWLRFIKLGLTAYKALGSFVTGQPPEVPRDSVAYLSETFQELQLDRPLSYPETPFPPDVCTILSRLPSGTSELCLTSPISIQMIKVLASIFATMELLQVESIKYNNFPVDTWTTISPDDSPSMLDSSQFDEDRKHIMIQTILSSLQRLTLTTMQPIEYNLTSGLLSFIFQLRDLGPINLFYDPILRKFITTLPNHAKPTSRQEQNCLIWSSMSVAGTLALRVVAMPDSHLVMDHALELYPQMHSWPRLEKILRTYFFTEAIGAHWKRVWQSAMSRRGFILRQRRQQVSYTRDGEDGEFDYTDLDADPESQAQTLNQGRADSMDRIPVQMPTDTPGFDMNSEAVRAHIQQHIAGAPRAMFQMSQAMGLCPMRSQWGNANVPSATLARDGSAVPSAMTTPSPRSWDGSVSTPETGVS